MLYKKPEFGLEFSSDVYHVKVIERNEIVVSAEDEEVPIYFYAIVSKMIKWTVVEKPDKWKGV